MRFTVLKIFFFYILFSSGYAFAQQKEGKQLTEAGLANLMEGKPVEKQILLYDSISGQNTNNDPGYALLCSNKALELAESSESSSLGHVLSNRAKAYRQLSEYDKAIADIARAYDFYSKRKNKKWLASLHIDYGNIYYITGDYDKALNNYLKGMKLAQEIKDVDMESMCMNNIANIYFYQENYDKAIEFYEKSYKVSREVGDSMRAALSYDNIGLVYISKEEYDMALMYQLSALKMVERLNDKKFLAEVLMNLGVVNQEMNKYGTALQYFFKADSIYKQIDSKYGRSGVLQNIGDNFRRQKKFREALEYLNQSMEISKSIGAKNGVKECAITISQVYEDMNDPANALKYYKIYSDLKDSIFTEESAQQINELSAKYENTKKQKEIELLKKEKDLNDIKLKQSRTLSIASVIGFGLIVMLAGLIFYRYREKKKANDLLEEKNMAINVQRELVTEKNREITDSINYAKRIQDAMLPSRKILNEYFKENFIFYSPKDIISGDFYWALRKEDKLYIAAADCTGHGVPGALMSMIGVTFLRQIINEMNVTDTAEILNRLHSLVLGALNEDVSRRDSKDGMDIALLKIDVINKKASFSGAVRPLYMAGKDGFEIIKGDRFSIGGIKTMEETFSKVEIDLSGGRSFYMFSDGFADQFGQASRKKFMIRRLQVTLQDICKLPMEEQYKQLSKIFSDWKGSLDQTDDVLLIGIKV